jgi:hypothetical protein
MEHEAGDGHQGVITPDELHLIDYREGCEEIQPASKDESPST